MNFIQKKLWIACSKFRFFRLPVEKRVRLEVEQDGRHLTFLLVSLYEAGHGVQVFGSQFVFRELMLLRKSAPIPFLYGGKERECGISISDRQAGNPPIEDSEEQMADGRNPAGSSTLVSGRSTLFFLDYDYFSGLTTGGVSHGGTANTGEEALQGLASQVGTSKASGPASTPATSHSLPATAPKALRAPYFMHPSVYHRGFHKRRSPITALDTRHSAESASTSHPLPVTSYPPQRRRRFRIGFFGTHDREFYTKHYHFPGMNRFEILEVFLQKFGNRMRRLRGFPRDWDPCEIAVSIDSRGGDRRGKFFLSQDHFFEALRECDFVLSPPGWCMPLSHNLIEAMFCGAIPITNGGAFMAEPLADGVNCLEFSNVAGFSHAMEKAFAMTDSEILELRLAAIDYYKRFLNPVAFANSLEMFGQGQLLVNAEEKSVPFVYPRFIWPPQ